MQVLEARDAEEALRIVEAAEEEEQEEEEVQDSVKEDNGGGVATTTRRRPPPPPPIVVAGSLYLVADVMRLARRLAPTPARWRMDGRMPEEHNHPLLLPCVHAMAYTAAKRERTCCSSSLESEIVRVSRGRTESGGKSLAKKTTE